MSDSLFEVLGVPEHSRNPELHRFLLQLVQLPVAGLEASEAPRQARSSHGLLLATQALAKKTHVPVVKSIDQHAQLRQSLPRLSQSVMRLRVAIPKADSETTHFSAVYSKSSDHHIIAKRRRDLLLLRNMERLVDIIEYPTLLSTAITSGSLSHSAALDLNSHIHRLYNLYPNSPLIGSVVQRTSSLVLQLASDLVISLGSSQGKLAPTMRTSSLIRRLLPDIMTHTFQSVHEQILGTLFILRRISTLDSTLNALEPLRLLAEEDVSNAPRGVGQWSGGQHAERYLKRYIEIFREHTFAMASIFKSMFIHQNSGSGDPLEQLPHGLATLLVYLVSELVKTLSTYLVGVSDTSSRDSILTQVLYCAGSLGRLGCDFSNVIFGLRSKAASQAEEQEWAEVAKRHRLLSTRLESALGDYKAGVR